MDRGREIIYSSISKYTGPTRCDLIAASVMADMVLYSERFAFMVYMSDAEYLRSEGKAPGSRFIDTVRPKRTQSNIDVESIIENVVEKGGLIRR